MQANKKKLIILLGVIVVVAVIIIAAASQSKKSTTPNGGTSKQVQTSMPAATTSPEEVAPSVDVTKMATATAEIVKTSSQVASGTSLITKDNKVITPEGTPVKLNVMPSSSE